MLSAAIVREVSRTAESAYVSGWTLTVDNLIRRTIGSDWESGYYRLTKPAAKRVANEINQEQPWAQTTPVLPAGDVIKAIAAAGKRGLAYDLDGELVK